MSISAAVFSTNVATVLTGVQVYNTRGVLVVLLTRSLATQHPTEPARNMPVWYPANKFQTGIRTERLSVGVDPFRSEDWTANYFYAHAQAGQDRYAQIHDDAISKNVTIITDALLAGLATLGVEDIEITGGDNPGIVFTPEGDRAYGAGVQLLVKDYRNK